MMAGEILAGRYELLGLLGTGVLLVLLGVLVLELFVANRSHG